MNAQSKSQQESQQLDYEELLALRKEVAALKMKKLLSKHKVSY